MINISLCIYKMGATGSVTLALGLLGFEQLDILILKKTNMTRRPRTLPQLKALG